MKTYKNYPNHRLNFDFQNYLSGTAQQKGKILAPPFNQQAMSKLLHWIEGEGVVARLQSVKGNSNINITTLYPSEK